jgi:hypothetical protein
MAIQPPPSIIIQTAQGKLLDIKKAFVQLKKTFQIEQEGSRGTDDACLVPIREEQHT